MSQLHQPRHTVSHARWLFWRNAKKGATFNGRRGIPMSPIVKANLGNPATASATYIVNAQAVAGAGAVTLAHGDVGANCNYGRTLQYVSSSASDTTQTVTTTGTNYLGETMIETASLNGTNVVSGKKAFASVTSVVASAAMVGNLSVGTYTGLGLPFCCMGLYDVIRAYMDTTDELATGTLATADTTNPATATTGDVRGTWTPATVPNGTHVYRIWYEVQSSTPTTPWIQPASGAGSYLQPSTLLPDTQVAYGVLDYNGTTQAPITDGSVG